MPRGKDGTKKTDAQPQPYLLDGEGVSGHAAMWSDVNPLTLLGTLAAVTARGDALLLATTSDGGAYAITVLAGDHKPRFYPADLAACEKTLNAIADWAIDAQNAIQNGN